MRLDLLSERLPATGGITAEGMLNLIGRPALSPMELVIREAAQNAWDARLVKKLKESPPPEFEIRLRTLSADQRLSLETLLPATAEPKAGNELLAQMASALPVRVLEFADFNTVGLSGEVDPSADRDEDRNFRSFFFDIGDEHAASGDGGTYGYGRSSLYLASRAKTIIVDSHVGGTEDNARRFMACRIGHRYERRGFTARTGARFTGRHFWGRSLGEGAIGPLLGSEATAAAESIGQPVRQDSRSGTTITILWPETGGRPLTGPALAEIALLHLWPKMVSDVGPLAMRIRVLEEGEAVNIPPVANHRTFGLFAAALLVARSREESLGARPIKLPRREIVTGHLSLEVGAPPRRSVEEPENPDQDGPSNPFTKGVSHVALMRPAELVVRYLEVPGAKADGRQWAGVFLSSDEEEIRNLFAEAEPPAHDDWVAERIVDVADRQIVSRTVRSLIPNAVRNAFGPRETDTGATNQAFSLAATADAFSSQFIGGAGTAPGEEIERSSKPRNTKPKVLKLSGPEFQSLRSDNGRPVARFRLHVEGATGRSVILRATAAIAIDGGGESSESPSDPVGLLPPEVLGWMSANEQVRTLGPDASPGSDGTYFIDVLFRGEYAVSLSVAGSED